MTYLHDPVGDQDSCKANPVVLSVAGFHQFICVAIVIKGHLPYGVTKSLRTITRASTEQVGGTAVVHAYWTCYWVCLGWDIENICDEDIQQGYDTHVAGGWYLGMRGLVAVALEDVVSLTVDSV